MGDGVPALRLSAQQLRDLDAALRSAFPERAGLARMVRLYLGESLDNIATTGTLRGDIFALLQWCEAQGRIADLINGARAENPANQELRQLAQDLGLALPLQPAPAKSRPRPFMLQVLAGSKSCTITLALGLALFVVVSGSALAGVITGLLNPTPTPAPTVTATLTLVPTIPPTAPPTATAVPIIPTATNPPTLTARPLTATPRPTQAPSATATPRPPTATATSTGTATVPATHSPTATVTTTRTPTVTNTPALAPTVIRVCASPSPLAFGRTTFMSEVYYNHLEIRERMGCALVPNSEEGVPGAVIQEFQHGYLFRDNAHQRMFVLIADTPGLVKNGDTGSWREYPDPDPDAPEGTTTSLTLLLGKQPTVAADLGDPLSDPVIETVTRNPNKPDQYHAGVQRFEQGAYLLWVFLQDYNPVFALYSDTHRWTAYNAR